MDGLPVLLMEAIAPSHDIRPAVSTHRKQSLPELPVASKTPPPLGPRPKPRPKPNLKQVSSILTAVYTSVSILVNF